MSEPDRYDHPRRLLGTGEITAGIGSTLEESRESVRAQKRAAVPSVEVRLPEGTTPAEADAAIVKELESIFDACARIRGFVEAMPEGTWPPKFRDGLLLDLYRILLAADVPWQALVPNPARPTLSGYFARLMREGHEIKDVRFGKGT